MSIAKAIKEYHDVFKTGHGSLNPSNIMFDAEGSVKLTGFGMESLRKYLSLTTDYTNISFYTDIELIGMSRQKTVLKPQKSADLYSFSIIFYEIISGNFKYRELTIAEVR